MISNQSTKPVHSSESTEGSLDKVPDSTSTKYLESTLKNKEEKSNETFFSQLKTTYESFDPEDSESEVKRQANQLINLIKALEKIEEDNVLISIGAAYKQKPEQQLPTYIQAISKHESVRVIMIDAMFGRPKFHGRFLDKDYYKLKNFPDDAKKSEYTSIDKQKKLAIQTFGCYLPDLNDSSEFIKFYSLFESSLSTILNRKGRVFIANHTEAYSLQCIPSIATLYNSLKKSHPNADLLQLYTQGGNGKVRYYLSNEYDTSTSKRYQVDIFEAPAGEFMVCDSLLDLCLVKEFSPRLKSSVLTTKNLFSKLAETESQKTEDLRLQPLPLKKSGLS